MRSDCTLCRYPVSSVRPGFVQRTQRLVERGLPRVPERRVPEIVSERDRLGQVLVERERTRDRAGYLRDLERVRHARAVVVAFRGQEDLRLVREPPKRLAVDDAVPVPLILRAIRVERDLPVAAASLVGEGGVPREAPMLFGLEGFTHHDVGQSVSHGVSPSRRRAPQRTVTRRTRRAQGDDERGPGDTDDRAPGRGEAPPHRTREAHAEQRAQERPRDRAGEQPRRSAGRGADT